MKKIIFVTPQLKSGGGNRVFVELANAISNLPDYATEITYPNNSAEINSYSVNKAVVIKSIGKLAEDIKGKLYNVVLLFKYLLNELKRDSEVTVIVSDPILSIFFMLIPNKYNLKIIRYVQADDYRIFDDGYVLKFKPFVYLFKILTRLTFNKKIRYIFNSRFSYDKFLLTSKRNDVPCIIIHPAVDKNRFVEQNSLKETKVSICLVARAHPLKKLDDFLDVWAEIDENIKKEVNQVFLISTDKLDRFNLKGLTVIRPKDDLAIAEVFNKSKIFISTSLWEGFSLPPLEAMHCGVAVISSNSGGITEYAKDNYNCLLYKPGDKEQLKERLITLIQNDELRNKLSSNAKITIKNFSWEQSAVSLIDLINNA